MKTNNQIKQLFLKKIETTPIESISVSSLCDELKIKRQTFYYHYRDIYDLVEDIFNEYKEDIIFSEYSEYYLRKILEFCSDNLYFLKVCGNSNLQELLSNFLFDLIKVYVHGRLLNISSSENLNNQDVNEITSYFTTAISSLIVNKIKTEDELNPDLLFNKIDLLSSKDVLNKIMLDYFENRKRI